MENDNTSTKPKNSVKELLGEPKLITTIYTEYENLISVVRRSDKEIWTCGLGSEMKRLNIQGSIMETMHTKSGAMPNDIAVTSDGDLLYTDGINGAVNRVKDGRIEEMIKLKNWKPLNLCVTSSGDLLVTMYGGGKAKRTAKTPSRVVRYSGFEKKQTIQSDDGGKPLFSGNDFIKYISENRNLDICVADSGVSAVVVVNQAGQFRFRYTGDTGTKPFKPYGITTDSQGQILTTDNDNNCIHILDQDGQFLRYIDNCDMKGPYGLCVDECDNLFVAEWDGKVKKIKYIE